MIKTILARGVLVLACGTTAFTVNTLAGVPAHAATAVSWTQRTCSAFSRWQDKPTTADLDKLVVFSLHLPRGYLAADVAELLADSVTAKPDQGYVSVAAQYVGEDCYGGA